MTNDEFAAGKGYERKDFGVWYNPKQRKAIIYNIKDYRFRLYGNVSMSADGVFLNTVQEWDHLKTAGCMADLFN